MNQHSPNASGLLVVGEALVEIMRPETGLPLGAPGPFQGPFPSGAPAIVADAAARAEASAALIATVGDDPFGALLRSRLHSDGVDISGVRVDEEAVTGVAFVAYDDSGGREFVFHVADAAPARLRSEDLGSAPEEAAWIHVSGSSLSLSENIAETVLAAVERVILAGGRVSFDPNVRLGSAGVSAAPRGVERLLKVSSLLLPSKGELEPLGVDAAALSESGPVVVCETSGEDGVCVYHDGQATPIPGLATEEIDPTGAGDTFSGTFLAVYMRSGDPILAAREANAAAAAHVKALGPMESGPRSLANEHVSIEEDS